MDLPDAPVSDQHPPPQPMVVTSVPNPMSIADADEANKRTALAGQWRTPPTPFFPGTSTEEMASAVYDTRVIKTEQVAAVPEPAAVVPASISTLTAVEVTVPPMVDVPQLPNSTEDYAKALQEAYRRGAEAAARAAAQQMASSAATAAAAAQSYPDFLQQQPAGSATPAAELGAPGLSAIVLPVTMSMPNNLSTTQATTTTTTTSAVAEQTMQVQVQMLHHHITAPAATLEQSVPIALEVAPPSSAAPPPPPTKAALQASVQQQQQQQRSVSLPDMSSYAAQQEDEKRQKRLARNRASARLRRLRKKNLVDAYETEVGILERTIQQLQQHEWGAATAGHSATALAEALSMDRGQQKLTVDERNQAATDILQQQLQFLQQLEDLMQEQFVLQQVASCSINGNTNGEWNDLQETLQLSPEQCERLVEQSAGWHDEWSALQTVKTSLQAMKENEWLWNEGCSAITDQFLAILHSNQISKFLLWADHNAETIEELDAVHAIHAVQDSPVFQFGVDSNPNEMLEDEKTGA